MDDSLKVSSTVDVFKALVLDLADVSLGARLNGAGIGITFTCDFESSYFLCNF